MTIIITPEGNTLPKIGYKDICQGANVSASNQDADFPVENIFNYLPYDSWKATATGTYYINIPLSAAAVVNYFGIYNHNLESIKLQHSTDGGVIWNDTSSLVMLTSSGVSFNPVTQVNAGNYRLQVTNLTSIPQLSIAMVGELLSLERGMLPGFIPPRMADEDEYTLNESVDGIELGVSLKRKIARSNIQFVSATTAWIRSEFEPFRQHMKSKPFFFSWNHENYPNDAVLSWRDGKPPKPRYSSPGFQDVSFNIRSKY